MFAIIKTVNRPHFNDVVRLITRDRPTQIVAALSVCALAFWKGHIGVALGVAIWVLVFETISVLVFKRRRVLSGLDSDQLLLIGFFLGILNTFIYLLPSLFLARDPSIAMKVIAILWVLGAQVQIANTWSRVPLFLYARLIPAFLILALTVLQMPATPPAASTPTEWGMVLASVCAFIYVSTETLRVHMKVEHALVVAEASASARASQLEDALRIDALTGLLNRRSFDTALNVMLEDLHETDGQVAVYMLGLDNFKPINDTYSHIAGDIVLETIAERLKRVVGNCGIVGRMGGDEFICAVCDLDGDADARRMAQDLGQVISRTINWEAHQLKVTASIGVALTNPKGTPRSDTVSALCSAADQAMSMAKRAPESGLILHHPNLLENQLSATDKQALIEAVSNHRLRPYYQPKIDLMTGQTLGFEALARWHHPDGSIRGPKDFMSEIDALGLQQEVSTSMARQVVADIKQMLDQHLDPGQISFNVPGIMLASAQKRRALQAIIAQDAQIARRLTLEITADAFTDRTADAVGASIKALRDRGIKISLDDFGTGVAPFPLLQHFDLDEIKIDTSFIEHLGQDTANDIVVRSFIDTAFQLGLAVIAEGVETSAQKQALLAMGCKTAQGYLFRPAIPHEKAIALLERQTAA